MSEIIHVFLSHSLGLEVLPGNPTEAHFKNSLQEAFKLYPALKVEKVINLTSDEAKDNNIKFRNWFHKEYHGKTYRLISLEHTHCFHKAFDIVANDLMKYMMSFLKPRRNGLTVLDRIRLLVPFTKEKEFNELFVEGIKTAQEVLRNFDPNIENAIFCVGKCFMDVLKV